MKTKFKHFYPDMDINSENIKDNDILVCLDANVLLNVYRYSEEIKSDLLSILEEQKNLFIPYNAALEFNYNKKNILNSVISQKDEINNSVDKMFNNTINKFKEILDRKTKLKCIKSKKTLKSIIDNFNSEIESLKEKIYSKELEKYYNLYSDLSQNDSISDTFASILEGHVGEPYNATELEKIMDEANERFEKNIPPGFDDDDKNDFSTYFYNGETIHFEKKYSDYIIWRQIIDHVKENGDKFNYILFITDDNKKDWVYEISGQKIGIRAELRNEFLDSTEKYIKLVNTNTYLQYFKDSHSEFIESKVVLNHNNTEFSIDGFENYNKNLGPNSNNELVEFKSKISILKKRISSFSFKLKNKKEISNISYSYYENKINEFKRDLCELSDCLYYELQHYASSETYLLYSLEVDNIEETLFNLKEEIHEKKELDILF